LRKRWLLPSCKSAVQIGDLSAAFWFSSREISSKAFFTEKLQLFDILWRRLREAAHGGIVSMKSIVVTTLLGCTVLLTIVVSADGQAPANSYRVVNLVSNIAGTAAVTDPNLLDAWGISNPNTPFWVSDHGSGLSTVYAATGVASATVVKIPGAAGAAGKPTGQVQNSGGTAFSLANGKAASFIFATEDGLITAWNSGSASLAEVDVDNSAKNAVYKGLAIGTSAAGGTLYGANFHSGHIDTWGPGFAPVALAGTFSDPAVPSGFAPFNIWNLNSNLYVEYAKQDSAGAHDVAGAGNGYVSVFDQNGNLLQHLVSGGPLNSPWGVAIAPAGWGAFGGALLVGNFGDGHINAFNATTGTSLGALSDSNGNPLAISGLWGLLFGSGTKADGNTLYFVAGVPGGSSTPRGLLGSIAPPSAVTAVANAASWQLGPVAPGELIVLGGQTVGAIPLVSAVIPASGSLATTLGGVTVTINGIAAPILYTSGSETSVQIPDALIPSPFSQSAFIVVQTPGQTSQSFYVPLAPSAPGLFAANSSGSGQLAAMNQDGSTNSATNAATAGSTVAMYATGEGITAPPGIDGAIQAQGARAPDLPVTVTIGGQQAQLVSAGTPVGELSGLMVVRAVVPDGLTAGPVPVILKVGSVSTTQSVTIGVK
jgi:uncharacterized protein (TIGR03118 family)